MLKESPNHDESRRVTESYGKLSAVAGTSLKTKGNKVGDAHLPPVRPHYSFCDILPMSAHDSLRTKGYEDPKAPNLR